MAASGADAGARAIGADVDVGFAWSGRRRWCRRRSSAASYRVIDNDRKFRSTDSGSQCRALSPDFPAGARGLYPLARGCRIRPARGMAPALMVCWIAGGAGFFFLALLPGGAVELPGRSRPAPGVVGIRWGGSMSSSLSRFSGWRSRSLSLGEGLPDSTGARDGTRADGVLDRGRRRLFLFSFIAWRRRRATGSIAAGTWRCRHSLGWLNVELSLPIFRLALAVFIPWRGAAGFDRRAGWHPR